MSTLLVVGFTDSARGVIDQLQKRPDGEILWVGENFGKPPVHTDIEVIDVLNPTYPDNLQEITEQYGPDMIFLCPGAERDLQDLLEGDTLERFLYQEDMRTQNVPVIVISSEHHTQP